MWVFRAQEQFELEIHIWSINDNWNCGFAEISQGRLTENVENIASTSLMNPSISWLNGEWWSS